MAAASHSPCRPFHRGFSLLELLATLALIGALAAIACGVVASTMARSALLRAEADLSAIATALEAYQRHYGDYPRTTDPVRLLESLTGTRGPAGGTTTGPDFIGTAVGLSPEASSVMQDPWGNAYRYRYDASWNGEYVLWSAGPDGRDESGADGRPAPGSAVNADNVGPMPR